MSPVEGQTTDKTIKSHKMIILALDYKFTENGTWVPIPIQQYSGSFVEQPEQTDAGILMSAEVTAYMPVIDDTKNAMVGQLNRRPAIFRVTDACNHYFEIGSDAELAVFSGSEKIGPNPGVAYGWDIKITCLSVLGAKMSSFTN